MVPARLLIPMPQFGELLARIRAERGLTQAELAENAGVSLSLVQRGERSDECPWRSATAINILRVIHRRMPLAGAEYGEYLQLAGLIEMARHADRTSLDEALGLSPLWNPSAGYVAFESDDATAFDFVKTLIDARGGHNVATALEGIAAAWNVDLPPRRQPGRAGPTWMQSSERPPPTASEPQKLKPPPGSVRIDTPDGPEFHPIKPPPAKPTATPAKPDIPTTTRRRASR